MSEIKDIGLFESGERKIQWVKANMPLLRTLEEEFLADKPFKGLKVALSVHLEAKTAYLCRVLAAGGANMQARLTIKTIFKIDSLTTRYRLPAFTADDHLFARTLDGTIAP